MVKAEYMGLRKPHILRAVRGKEHEFKTKKTQIPIVLYGNTICSVFYIYRLPPV